MMFFKITKKRLTLLLPYLLCSSSMKPARSPCSKCPLFGSDHTPSEGFFSAMRSEGHTPRGPTSLCCTAIDFARKRANRASFRTCDHRLLHKR